MCVFQQSRTEAFLVNHCFRPLLNCDWLCSTWVGLVSNQIELTRTGFRKLKDKLFQAMNIILKTPVVVTKIKVFLSHPDSSAIGERKQFVPALTQNLKNP